MPTGGLDTRRGSIEAEVRENVLSQPMGVGTVADLCLPESLLDEIVDRVVRTSFEERCRAVVSDAAPETTVEMSDVEAAAGGNEEAGNSTAAGFVIERLEAEPVERDGLALWSDARPGCRAFRAPMTRGLGLVGEVSPSAGGSDRPDEVGGVPREAAAYVCRRLARDGLLRTLAGVMRLLGSSRFVEAGEPELLELARAGVPVDLLGHFRCLDDSANPAQEQLVDDRAARIVRHVARLVQMNSAGPGDIDLPARFEFGFERADARLVLHDDAGEDDVSVLRTQMTRGGHWLGPGSGDNLDLLRQVGEAVPDMPMIVSIEAKFADEFERHVRRWKRGEKGRVTIIAQPTVVSQWAQDNARGGRLIVVPASSGAVQREQLAVLAPRYPSRGDDGSVFVPGEAAVVRSLPRAGVTVVQSGLLFQGGNVLICADPKQPAQRLALIGEAEITRNVSLGLSPGQALKAIVKEFGVARAVVMPAVSYHIDYEMSVRRLPGGGMVAMVIDVPKGVRLVLESLMDVAERERLLPKPRLRAAKQHLAQDKWVELLEVIGSGILARGMNSSGQIVESFAALFARGKGEHGAGNLYRVLLALDLVSSWVKTPWEDSMHPHAQAYVRSLRRNQAGRERLHEVLRAEGFRVVGVPGLAGGDRSVCPVNGLSVGSRYLMSGSENVKIGNLERGFLSLLDDAGVEVMSLSMGTDVKVVGIRSAESLRRNGGVHCSFSAI